MHKLLLLLPLLIAACAPLGPDYIQPEVDLPQTWTQTVDQGPHPGTANIQKWWVLFNDPVLTNLIQQATAHNLDLQQAMARVDEAKATLEMTIGQALPSLDAQGSVTRQGSPSSALSPQGSTETISSVALDAGWELDLFGRIRRSIQASDAAYQASQEDRRDVMISMYSQVAQTYITLRTLQARLQTTHKNIASQQETLNLTRSRFDHGLATGLDVSQAERVLANTQAEIPPLRISLIQNMNTLCVLLGQHPGSLGRFRDKAGIIPQAAKTPETGIPADLLRQRPDVRRAERLLAAQTARIGIAKAELFPRLTLIGDVSFSSGEIDDLFTSTARAFEVGPSLRWSLFQGGRLRAQIREQDARARQALLTYEQRILDALQEVEDAMTGYVHQKNQITALQHSVQASTASLRMAEKLYKDGLADFQNVLDAQRSLFTAEDNLDQALGNAALYMVSLYKALGGGWDAHSTTEKGDQEVVTGGLEPEVITPGDTG